MTDRLKPPTGERIDMHDTDIAHIAGVIDAAGAITVHISKEESYALGYRFQPMIRLHRTKQDDVLLGKLDAFCEEAGVHYSLVAEERDSGTVYTFQVDQPESIRQFLDPLLLYLVSRYDQAMLMFELLDRMDEDAHKSKRGFYELVGAADELRSYSRHGPDPTYTQAYFENEWSAELAPA